MAANTEKVALSREKETLLITLCAKGEESRLPDSLLCDRFAAEAMGRIDYDFGRLGVTRNDMIALAMRAHVLDGWTREFIAKYPKATVLHLGCGLDSRVFRIDPPSDVRWFDVDYPEVIALRRRVYPERAGCTLVGASVTEPGWLAAMPSYRPAMVVAEGLLMYLAADAVPQLLARLTRHFPGGHMAFDGYSRLGLQLVRHHRSVRATGASLHWSIDDPHELERRIPKMKLLTELTALGAKGHDPRQLARMSWTARAAVRMFAMIPPLARVARLLRYSF